MIRSVLLASGIGVNGIDRVAGAERFGRIKRAVHLRRAALEIVIKVRGKRRDGIRLIVFQRILVFGRLDQPEIIDTSVGPRLRPSLHEVRNGNRRQKTDNRHHDHDFHKGETLAVPLDLHRKPLSALILTTIRACVEVS